MLIFDIVSGQKFSNTKIGKWLKYFSKEDVQMTNKHMKWCLTAEKFKFKPLWDTTQYSLGWLLSKTKQNSKYWWGYGEMGTLMPYWKEYKMV